MQTVANSKMATRACRGASPFALGQVHSSSARPCARIVVSQAVKTTEAPPITTTTVTEAQEPASNGNGQDIYIGFKKGDYGPRAGRQGQFIKDDPKKYPAKETLGWFLGATGGWAGGEAALWELREEVLKSSSSNSSSSSKAAAPSRPASLKPAAKSEAEAPIYLGFGKDEIELRKSGAKGRFILDNPRKYPAKEDLGVFTGATGGFAGGEAGLKQFVETGELKLRDPKQPIKKQFSPVALAGLLVLAGAGGGLLLNEVTDLGESAVNAEILQAPIDENTKILLLGAVGLLAGASVLGAARAAVSSLEERVTGAGEEAKKLVVLGGFWVAVFLVARFVLEF